MHGLIGMTLYRLLLPVLFVTAFPGWLVKMARRGGFGSGLRERIGWYRIPLEHEPCGAVHLHAVSVGEVMLALKLLREWRKESPDQRFVIATGTSTGHALAVEGAPDGVRVVYAPLDFGCLVRHYLNRFEPSQIVLVEGEAWPNLLSVCKRRKIPVRLVNARMSPRSRRRYLKFANWIRPVFSKLDGVAIQEREDASIWEELGVPPQRIHVTGSLKFDPGAGPLPTRRTEFTNMLELFGAGRPVILSASTHGEEEAWIARTVREALASALIVLVPRHAERRMSVKADLEKEGFEVVLRSSFSPPVDLARACLVIDTTGELRDWTAHADVVVIGKSFLGVGGQNPTEAVMAGKPLIFGPHMENFEPLATRLSELGGCARVTDEETLRKALQRFLQPSDELKAGLIEAKEWLARHEGATARTISFLSAGIPQSHG
jgi:3-deoxy-D-manno-octulosonic-acid transferase